MNPGPAATAEVRVWKVGGSLLGWPRLGHALAEVIRHEDARPLLVAGGGGAANLVRSWQPTHTLTQEQSHRLAIQATRLNAAMLAELLPRAQRVGSRKAAGAVWNAGGIAVLDLPEFLAGELAEVAHVLPACWEVTSDSLAALVATHWPARLTLLKSCGSGPGFVDPYFPTAAATLEPVQWINLRTGARGLFTALDGSKV